MVKCFFLSFSFSKLSKFRSVLSFTLIPLQFKPCFLPPVLLLLYLLPQTTKYTSGIGVVNFLSLSSQATRAPLTVWAGTRPSQASWLLPPMTAQYASGALHPSSNHKRQMGSTVVITVGYNMILFYICFCSCWFMLKFSSNHHFDLLNVYFLRRKLQSHGQLMVTNRAETVSLTTNNIPQ